MIEAGPRSYRTPFHVRFVTALLVIYWGALFWGTHTPNLSQGGGPSVDKLAHFTGYAGLSFLAAATWQVRRQTGWKEWAIVFLVIALYGVADEWSQNLVSGRHGDLRDWLADVGGAAVGLAVFAGLIALWRFCFPISEAKPSEGTARAAGTSGGRLDADQ